MHFSKKFRKAWMKSNQRMHDMLLARPKTRYLQRWPNPAFERPLPVKIPIAALRAHASARTLELSKPKPSPPVIMPRTLGEVDRAMLTYEPTERIKELARPALKEKAVAKSPSTTEKTKKRPYNKERVLVLCKKKPSHRPQPKEKKPPKPLSELMPRIKILCELPKRYQSPDLPAVPVASKLKLQEGEQTYEASERIKQLAQPRDYAEFRLDEEYDPYVINPGALKYVPTENIKKLAEPRHREEKRIKK